MPRRELELDLMPLYRHMSKTASNNKIPLKQALASTRFAQVGLNLFRDTSDTSIWRLEKGDDDVEYIVRAEEEEQMLVESSDDQEWAATSDSTKETVTLSHCGIPICKFAGKDCGFGRDSVEGFQKYLISKVRDPAFIRSLYAISTGKCPGCGENPVSIGVTSIRCGTIGCTYAAKSYRLLIGDSVIFTQGPEKGSQGEIRAVSDDQSYAEVRLRNGQVKWVNVDRLHVPYE